MLLNLDSEEDGALYIGCAGGAGHQGPGTVAREAAERGHVVALRAPRDGPARGPLRGGRSRESRQRGQDPRSRLLALARGGRRRLVVDRGRQQAQRHPARGRRGRLRPESGERRGRAIVERWQPVVARSWGRSTSTPGERAEAVGRAPPGPAASEPEAGPATHLALPHGVLAMSRAIPGLVETSTNLAVITDRRHAVSRVTSQRSRCLRDDEIAQTVTEHLRSGRGEGRPEGRLPRLEAEHRLADPEEGARGLPSR